MKSLKNFIRNTIFPRLAYFLMIGLYKTCKNNFHIDFDIKDYQDKANVYAFWHGELLMAVFLYRKFVKPNRAALITSKHGDGDAIGKVMNYFGVEDIKGSTNKGGVKVILESLKTLQSGISLVITPDGPRGPKHSLTDGFIAILEKSNTNLIGARILPQKYWQLKTWDGFKIPKPFSTIDYYVLPPFKINNIESDLKKNVVLNYLNSLPSRKM